MRVKHRIALTKGKLGKRELKRLEMFLGQKIIFDEDGFMILYVFEDHDYWPEIKKTIKRKKVLMMEEPVYSKEEFDNAEWLTIRSKWRWGYPQPEDDFAYVHVTYDSSNYCDKCGSGLVQREDCFRMKKAPNWASRNFLMLFWVEDELFISNKVEKALLESDLTGFRIYDVKNKKGDKSYDTVKQLFVEEQLKPGMMIEKDMIKEKNDCVKCGSKRVIIADRGIIFNKEPFKNVNVDIIKSHEVFGGGLESDRYIIISKKFYNLIVDNGLDRNVEFQPIQLV